MKSFSVFSLMIFRNSFKCFESSKDFVYVFFRNFCLRFQRQLQSARFPPYLLYHILRCPHRLHCSHVPRHALSPLEIIHLSTFKVKINKIIFASKPRLTAHYNYYQNFCFSSIYQNIQDFSLLKLHSPTSIYYV